MFFLFNVLTLMIMQPYFLMAKELDGIIDSYEAKLTDGPTRIRREKNTLICQTMSMLDSSIEVLC